MKLRSFVLILASVFVTACASQQGLNYTQAEAVSINQYSSFSVKPLFIKGHDNKIEHVVETAIKSALEGRGLVFSTTNADLEVQYAAGITSTQAVDLKPVSSGTATYVSHDVVAQTHGTLLINIQDTKTKENVWRSSGSGSIRSGSLSQSKANEEFAKIFEHFE